MRPPLIQRPTYLDGAPIDVAAACDACKKHVPGAGLIGAAMVAALAGYFVPKVLDGALTKLRSVGQPDDDEFDYIEEDE